jgi:hypothetical protein
MEHPHQCPAYNGQRPEIVGTKLGAMAHGHSGGGLGLGYVLGWLGDGHGPNHTIRV